MQIILIILSILAFIAMIVIPVVIVINIDDMKWYHYILITITVIVLNISTICVVDKAVTYNKPKAIDVYRNKTTLQITYVDTIPQDTIVVFK